VTLDDVQPVALERLASSYRAFAFAANRPVVFKNLLCSLRLEPISEALPEAVFVVVRRDVLPNARSLLRARVRANSNYTDWFSAEPPDIDALRQLSPHEAVVEQIRSIDGLIDTNRTAIGHHRFHDIRYEELCADPHGVLDSVATFASDAAGVELRAVRDVPDVFTAGPCEGELDAELDANLERYLSRTGPEHV
jgi:LPS sulfotransferase NodH